MLGLILNKIQNTMKIGILTQPLHTNYGGILQAYALQTVLERMGHEVQVLDREQKMHVNKYRFPLSVAKRVVKNIFLVERSAYFKNIISIAPIPS